eukprot:7184032-Alexandrium_andersonii.AAC.1
MVAAETFELSDAVLPQNAVAVDDLAQRLSSIPQKRPDPHGKPFLDSFNLLLESALAKLKSIEEVKLTYAVQQVRAAIDDFEPCAYGGAGGA